MNLFFASDLHGCLTTTQETLAKFDASDADILVLLGDLLNHGPRNSVPEGYDPAAVADLLNSYKDKIIAVRGNCDSEVDQMLLQFPMMLDSSWILLESGKRIFLTHGHIYNSSNRPALKSGDVIAHGHTHLPVAEQDGEQIIFNPGSVTFPKGGFVRSYGLLEDEMLKVVSFEGEVLAETRI
ncbi:phosphodiesterase [Vibrio sp. JC009]|uniref:phosphodiesterase n=1 Tax=Vibrio sp. JC009 TaxID=2912314 RepID=UPI0023B156CB|nr:phosphodiesterase [Vibrio sp. JC009]WED20994.1 phosphodiesterase [Vibrio sp. JC009]